MSKSIIINEQQVLACILSNPDLLDLDSKNWFTNPISICIYDSLRKLKKNSVSFSTSTIVSECAKVNNDVTHQIIEDIKNKVSYDKKDFEYYCRRLREDYVKEDLQGRVLKTATSHLLSKGELDIQQLRSTIDDIEKAIDLVEQKNAKLKSFQTILPKYEDDLNNRGLNNNFTSTGNAYLDSKLTGGGIPKGQFITLFAGPGMGKSTVALNNVNGNINKQVPLLYLPLEMGEMLSLDKLISLRTKIPLQKFYEVDKLSDSVAEYVIEAFKVEKAKLLRNKNFRITDSASMSLPTLHTLVKDFKKELKVDTVQIVVDLFTMMIEGRGENKASSLQDLCDGFFEMLKEESATAVAVVQSKRKETYNVQTYEDCMKYTPHIEDIKGSQGFEERSRAIISVFRQKHIAMRMLGEADPETQIADDVLKLTILKQNLGSLAELDFLYQGDIGKLWKFEKDEND